MEAFILKMGILDLFSAKRKLEAMEAQISNERSDLHAEIFKLQNKCEELTTTANGKSIECERLDKLCHETSAALEKIKQEQHEFNVLWQKRKSEILQERFILEKEFLEYKDEIETESQLLKDEIWDLRIERRKLNSTDTAIPFSPQEAITPIEQPQVPTVSTQTTESHKDSPKPRIRKQRTNPSVKPCDTLKEKPTWKYSPYRYLMRRRLNKGYETLTTAMIAESDKENCIICGKPTKETIREHLSNGLFVHMECYDAMSEQMCAYTNDEKIPSIGKDYERIRRFMIANCYWPTYPEDWDQRKEIVLEAADYQCEECEGNSDMLCVHHKQWLSQGGSNALDNLQCLCYKCHEKAHGRSLPIGESFPQPKNRPLIQEAMNQGKDIEFNYVDVKGVRTRRPVTPLRFISSPHGHPAISAMDHLDNALVPYTFLIRKMTHLTIIN